MKLYAFNDIPDKARSDAALEVGLDARHARAILADSDYLGGRYDACIDEATLLKATVVEQHMSHIGEDKMQ